LRAVRKLALNEWALQHRYAMALHTDEEHPHVHVVVRAVSEQGVRLNIKKATLRAWRSQFAANLRELGVAANATERAVRGETRTHKTTRIYRAAQRNDSTHMRQREAQVLREVTSGARLSDPGFAEIYRTRQAVVAGWRTLETGLRESGDYELANDAQAFVDRMPPVQTEKAMLAQRMLIRMRGRWSALPDRTR
jgi:DNA-binding transcriptional regulator YiaG